VFENSVLREIFVPQKGETEDWRKLQTRSFMLCKENKVIPLKAWTSPERSRRLRLLDF
jgi:hypothetical protein